MDASIIICTCNRANDLRATLHSIAGCEMPANLSVELLVIDNASTDHTKEVVEATSVLQMPVRYVYEPKRGKGNAYNRGMAEALGNIILWTDDDVRVPINWVEEMCSPILEGEADAVQGSIKIAPHLVRPWMQPLHRSWFASTELINKNAADCLIGANMALERRIFVKVPEFDIELGPGALGFEDDILFSKQVMRAGYHITFTSNTEIEHHFDPSRLTRAALSERAIKNGRSLAYVAHHWEHKFVLAPRRHLVAWIVQLYRYRAKNWKYKTKEGMSSVEMQILLQIGFYRQYLIECKRPRNYERHGLVKLINN